MMLCLHTVWHTVVVVDIIVTGDKELIQEVLFDAVVTAPIEAYWTSLALNKSEYEESLHPKSHMTYLIMPKT